jgi:hypothetical protein
MAKASRFCVDQQPFILFNVVPLLILIFLLHLWYQSFKFLNFFSLEFDVYLYRRKLIEKTLPLVPFAPFFKKKRKISCEIIIIFWFAIEG